MAKHELIADTEVDVNAPRSKRHRDDDGKQPTKDVNNGREKEASSERDDENDVDVTETVPSMSPEEVREEGLKVLQVLRDAVNKEGRQISYEFLRLPSKRQFPDYYQIIERPIALDDIKIQLDDHTYPSLEALRADLETCFKNARRYNQRESVIWRDAKTLQKLANKEIEKRVRKGDEDDGSDKEDGKKKEKGVNIHRLMKNRLQKLTEKADDNGRRYSDAFMDLPSKKKWPVYYKSIQRPICIEDIFKRIKRKEYHTIQDFIADVDLVFENAMTFNEEYSPIWEDAVVLKTYFQQLMSSLPAKYNMNGADARSSASPEIPHNKIKLKLPGYQATIQSGGTDAGHGSEVSTATVRLRVPGLGGSGSGGAATSTVKETSITPPKKVKTASPVAPASVLPSATSVHSQSHTSTSPPGLAAASASALTPALAMPTPKPAKLSTSAHFKVAVPTQTPSQQQQPSQYAAFHQYTTPSQIPPQNFYAPPGAGASSQTSAHSPTTPVPAVPQPAVTTGRTDPPSPIPPPSAAGLYSVRLDCCPPGKSGVRRRLAVLDSKAGVRSFALRVPITEAKLVIHSVKFASHHGDGDGADGTDAEEEVKVVQTPVKKRGRGRPRKIPIDQEVRPDVQLERSSPAPVPTPAPKPDEKKDRREWREASPSEVEVKLDGKEVTPAKKDMPNNATVLVNGNAESSSGGVDSASPTKPEDEWTAELTAGQHILEIGRKGNSVPWRVYLTVS